MKKMLSLSFAAMFIVSCVSGCGKKDDSSSETKKESKFVGKWECEKLAWNGKEMDSLLGTPANVLLQAEIKDDGTFVAHSAMEDSVDASNEGSWKEISDTKLEVKGKLLGEDRNIEIEYKDDKLVADLTESGTNAVIYLVKVDEFTPMDSEDASSEFNLSDVDFKISPSSDINMDFELKEIDFNFDESDFCA
ncbi:MAG: hypothetical protein II656_08570 [Ruminococcus sp.]|nr:hypothetical protein [Ruminococcus sp.]